MKFYRKEAIGMKIKRFLYLVVIFVFYVSASLSAFGTSPNNNNINNEIETNILEQDKIKSMRKIEESENLILYFNDKTAEIAVKQKSTGNTFFSNPVNIENDNINAANVKNELKSQIKLEYVAKNKIFKMNSWENCISLNQFTFNKIKNGISVSMSIGRVNQQKLFPNLITKENFEKRILNKLDEKSKSTILKCYKFYSLKDAVDEEQKKDWLDRFPILSEHDIYAIRGIYTTNDLATRLQDKLEKYMQEVNYTLDMVKEDHQLTGYEEEGDNFALFNIDIQYTIEGDQLYVKIPSESIQYDTENFHLLKLMPMEYLGAGKTGTDGYIFIPDGSGALVNFNNSGNKKMLYTTYPVYGKDFSVKQEDTIKSSVHFPVLGIDSGDRGLFAIIESGDAIADITCELGNIIHPYNAAFPTFNIAYKDMFMMSYGTSGGEDNGASVVTVDKNEFKGDIRVRYSFLSENNSDYSGMAKEYREYLINKEVLKNNSKNDIPFYLEVLGSINKVGKFWGINKRMDIPLTTYKESELIINELLNDDITNINLIYKGWQNGGLNYTAPTKINNIRSLGGNKEFNNLIHRLNQNNIGFFPDVDMMYVYEDEFFDGFNYRQDSAKMLDKSIAAKSKIRLANSKVNYNTFMFTISPNMLKSYVDKYMDQYNKYDINNISLGSLGNSLNSDFNRKHPVNREQAKALVINQLDKIDNENKIMVEGGNAYTLPYVSHIVNIPEDNSKFQIYDEVIPFMQMVLHGYVNYAGSPANLSSDYDEHILKSIETGSSIYFTLAYKNTDELKDSNNNGYYSVEYKNWIDDAKIAYKTVNSVLKEINDQVITKHEMLEKGVYRTTYENGTKIIVNYTDNEVKIQDYKINAKGFKLIK